MLQCYSSPDHHVDHVVNLRPSELPHRNLFLGKTEETVQRAANILIVSRLQSLPELQAIKGLSSF